uniref:Uncharacterized protein n=1 Tax=viral metagenome TaxID=1070528 RepID=A0A6M3JPW4_9ZZZZ
MRYKNEEYTDVCVGQMSADTIGKEIKHYLNGYYKPSKLLVSIEKEDNLFYTRIYLLTREFNPEPPNVICL